MEKNGFYPAPSKYAKKSASRDGDGKGLAEGRFMTRHGEILIGRPTGAGLIKFADSVYHRGADEKIFGSDSQRKASGSLPDLPVLAGRAS